MANPPPPTPESPTLADDVAVVAELMPGWQADSMRGVPGFSIYREDCDDPDQEFSFLPASSPTAWAAVLEKCDEVGWETFIWSDGDGHDCSVGSSKFGAIERSAPTRGEAVIKAVAAAVRAMNADEGVAG